MNKIISSFGSKKKVRTRFAPSPTGALHMGGARTALFNWLFARQLGGEFILRIEDTDKERNSEKAEKAILQDLRWLGLDWDEGPQKEGDFPYRQSERENFYHHWFEQLQKTGRVYADEEAYRFRFERRKMLFEDAICGKIAIDYENEENTPDMVIRRSDGSYVFHFVNVVDDLQMQISHIIRGEDHLHNTAKHIQILEALGEEIPCYAHIPLIQNMDGSKMSKRDKNADISYYRNLGYLPSALINFFVLLGWRPENEREVLLLEEILESFSLSDIQRSPARFDEEKCAWLNGQHLKALSKESFYQEAIKFLPNGLGEKEKIRKAVFCIQEKVRTLGEIPSQIDFLVGENYTCEAEAMKKLEMMEIKELLCQCVFNFKDLDVWEADLVKENLKKLAKKNNIKVGKLMLACRIALSGRIGGADLGEIFSILGREKTIERLENAIKEK